MGAHRMGNSRVFARRAFDGRALAWQINSDGQISTEKINIAGQNKQK